jgi:hypothetical protein
MSDHPLVMALHRESLSQLQMTQRARYPQSRSLRQRDGKRLTGFGMIATFGRGAFTSRSPRQIDLPESR